MLATSEHALSHSSATNICLELAETDYAHSNEQPKRESGQDSSRGLLSRTPVYYVGQPVVPVSKVESSRRTKHKNPGAILYPLPSPEIGSEHNRNLQKASNLNWTHGDKIHALEDLPSVL